MAGVNTADGKAAADCGCSSNSVLSASSKARMCSAWLGVSLVCGLGAGAGVDERETLAAKSARGGRYGGWLRSAGRLYQFRTGPGGGTDAYRTSGIGRGAHGLDAYQ